MKTAFVNLRNWTLLILVTVMALPVIAEGSLDMGLLGNSGWSAAVNQDWDVGIVVDAVTDDAVIVQIIKRFIGEPDEFGLMPAIYMEFIKNSEQAVGQIIINDEFVTNDTSVPWIDYHIELTVEAGFSRESNPSGDQFATVVLGGSNGYNGLPTKFDFFDGLVPTNPEDQDDFRPGYDSGSMIIIADPEMQVGQRIVLKEYPTIPEPATLGLLLFGGLTSLMKRRR